MKVLINCVLCSIVLLNFLTLSCQQGTDGTGNDSGMAPVPRGIETFENSIMEIKADTDRAIVDSLITITTRCKPLFTGKGRIKLIAGGGGTSVVIVSPVQDTISATDSIRWRTTHVDFTANETFEQEWKIRLINQAAYSFGSRAILDSVFIADSSKTYYIFSEEVKVLSPDGWFRNEAVSYPNVNLIP